jgi:hypothetical protein
MSLFKYTSVGLTLVLLSTAAVAFQEQKSGTTPEAAPAAVQPEAKPVELSNSADALKPTLGTEVRIPGLGKLGSLPKMDFGLELLYGATEAKQQPEPQTRDENRDDLTIRGTVKHKF